MKRIIYQLLLLFAIGFDVSAQQLNYREYFFDTDPGPGNGFGTFFSPADSITDNLTISTNGLSQGFHRLYIRYRSNNGKWSIPEHLVFIIYPSTPPPAPIVQPLITKGEYFFDTDPGPGNGTPTATFSAVDSVTQNLTIPTTGLSEGYHMLYIRYKDASGKWSLPERVTFVVNTTPPNPLVNMNTSRLKKGEYYFNTDPGPENGTALPNFSASDSVLQNLTIPTTGLVAGNHALYIRYCDSLGKWSLSERLTFNICIAPPTVTISAIGTTALCTGGSVLLKADTTGGTAGKNYQWLKDNVVINGATSYSYSATQVGAYKLQMYDTSCTGVSNSISVTVNNNVFTPSVTITSNPISSCSGTPYVFTAVPQNGGITPSYQWKKNNVNVGTNSSTYSVTPAYGDIIKCVMISNAQCASVPSVNSNSITTKFQFLGADIIKYILPNTTRNLTNIVSFPGASYSYRRSNWSTVFFPTSVPVGIYYIIGTVNASCKDTLKVTVKLGNVANKAEFDAEKDEAEFNPPQFKVYPNPINDAFVLEFISEVAGFGSVKLYDVAGRLIYRQNIVVQEGLNHQECSVDNLADGLYLLQFVMNDEIQYTEKLLRRR